MAVKSIAGKACITIFCLTCLTGIFWGCSKEYSYEGGSVAANVSNTNSGTSPDTSKNSTFVIPTCIACKGFDTTSVNSWHFRSNESIFCGSVTNAVLSPDRTAITIFGPSVCSLDTGLILTAYFNDAALAGDQINLRASFATLQYYDNVSGVDMLQSKPSHLFQIIFRDYSFLKRIATGTFLGAVVSKNGVSVNIQGEFKTRF